MSATWIAQALDRLQADIAAGNTAGNVEGLLARHIVGDDPRLDIAWSVDCEPDWVRDGYDPSSLPAVAALGYTVAVTPKPGLLPALEDGMCRAVARDPAMMGPGAALQAPAVLVGLALAVNRLRTGQEQSSTWMAGVIRCLQRPNSPRLDPLRVHAARLCGIDLGEPQVDSAAPLLHCAAVEWWLGLGESASFPDMERRRALRASIVERTLAEDTGQRSPHEAALLWRVLRRAVSEETAGALRTRHTVTRLLSQFEPCLRRWRWDSDQLRFPVRWAIRSEREVQDILLLMLRCVFDDIVDEDTLPKFGHSSYRADFGIPSLGLLIEVKFARSATDFKDIEKEVLQDLVPYLGSPERYREVLVFVYDDSCSVQEHDATVRALMSAPGVVDVVIVSRPSQLPVGTTQDESLTKFSMRSGGTG